MKEYTVPSPSGGDMTVLLDESSAKELAGAKLHDGSVHAQFHDRVAAIEAAAKEASQPANKARAASTVKNK